METPKPILHSLQIILDAINKKIDSGEFSNGEAKSLIPSLKDQIGFWSRMPASVKENVRKLIARIESLE